MKECIKCHSSCSKCQNELAIGCLECESDKILCQGRCTVKCPDDKKYSEEICLS